MDHMLVDGFLKDGLEAVKGRNDTRVGGVQCRGTAHRPNALVLDGHQTDHGLRLGFGSFDFGAVFGVVRLDVMQELKSLFR